MAVLLIKKLRYKLNFKDKNLLFLISINILPIFLMLLTSMITGSKIRTMWMTPFYLFFGTLIIYVFQKEISKANFKKFFVAFVFLFLLSPVTYGYISIVKTDKRTDYPGKEIANKVEAKWNKDTSPVIGINYPKTVCHIKISSDYAWTRYYFHIISITDLNWDSWIKQVYSMTFLLNSHCCQVYASICLIAATGYRHPFKVAANF